MERSTSVGTPSSFSFPLSDSGSAMPGRYLLMAFIAASLHSDFMSAPVYPCSWGASLPTSTSGAMGMPLVCMSSISCRPSSFGTDISNSLSNLPGRLRAGSTPSGLLVAPSTITFPLSLSPSIRASSWATTRFSTSPRDSSRLGAIASISSMNIMLGDAPFASSNISLSLASVSP